MTRVFTYPGRIILGGYLRAVFGIALTLVPLLLLNPISVIVYLLVFLLCVFAGYGVRAIIRQFTRFEVSGTGIVMSGPVNRSINWEDLEGFSLNYYSTRRDREAGWMHLKLKGGGARLGIDSTITDFKDLVRISLGAAADNGLIPDARTARNLQSLGIARPEGGRSVAYGTVN